MKANIPRQIFNLDVFKKQLKLIKDEGIKFINPKEFGKSLRSKKTEKFY